MTADMRPSVFFYYASLQGSQNGQHWGTSTPNHGNSTQAPDPNLPIGTSPTSLTIEGANPNSRETCIRTGEITGYRVWRANNTRLRSLVMGHVWTPNAIEMVDYPLPLPWGYGYGFHAFKTLELAEHEMEIGEANYLCSDLVMGEVEMWGEVIEHALGYRSRYVKITKLHRMMSLPRRRIVRLFRRDPLKKLRKIYGVN